MIEVHVHLYEFSKNIQNIEYQMSIEECDFFIRNLKYGTRIEIGDSLFTYNKNNPPVMRIDYGRENKPIFYYEINLDIVITQKRI